MMNEDSGWEVLKRPMTAALFAQIKALDSTGWVYREIAKHCKCGTATVGRVMRSKNFDIYQGHRRGETVRLEAARARHPANVPVVAESYENDIQRLYDIGYTTRQVRTELKISQDTITRLNRVRRRTGLPTLVQKKIGRRHVEPQRVISKGLQHIAFLMERIQTEQQSLVTITADWHIEWEDRTKALQHNMTSFRRHLQLLREKGATNVHAQKPTLRVSHDMGPRLRHGHQ